MGFTSFYSKGFLAIYQDGEIMREYIDKNTTVTLLSNGQKQKFTVNDIIGIGGSCIAYNVTYYEDGNIPHNAVLKEYCPAFLDESPDYSREDNRIVIPNELSDRFKIGLESFKNTYKNINEYIDRHSSARNYHPVQLGLYEGNNTLYTLSSSDYGKSYDKIEDKNISMVIRLMIATAKAVERYHRAGFLHLDIKPKNILVLDEVTDLIKLFDFDSLTPIADLHNRKDVPIPMPEDYYVPELNNLNLRKIGVQTDVFEIGAMFFMRLFGYAPQPSDLQHDAKYNYNKAKLLESVSPKAFFEINELFKNTLQISPRRRYKNISQLIEQLNKILSIVSDKEPHLVNCSVWQPSKLCIERTDDIRKIDDRLNNDGYVFIRGIGGIGKSELAKIYVQKYKSKYHTIQFCKYIDSLKSLVASLAVDGINEEDYTDFDSLVRAKNKVLHKSDKHTLIIVDNFNVTHDNFLRDFLPVNKDLFKVIFTTRCIPAADYYEDKIFKVNPLSIEDAVNLFYLQSKLNQNSSNTNDIANLIEEIQYNTLLLTLIAKVVSRTGISVNDMIEKLRNQSIDEVDYKVFHEYDYSDEEISVYNKINQHLSIVYDISGLSTIETEVLLDMTLVSPLGISVKEFVVNSKNSDDTYSSVNNLISQGWIELKEELISLHSITSDVIANKIKDRTDSYFKLCEFLESQCNIDDESHISLIQRALAIALQLDRRYKDEDDSWISNISFILGMIYSSLYRPKEAGKYYDKAINIETKNRNYDNLIVLCSQIGEFEQKFGTKTKAVYWFEKAISTATITDDDVSEEVLNSLLGIAECYESDNQKSLATDKFIEAFNYAEKHGLTNFVQGILKHIVELLTELGREDELNYYSRVFGKYGGERPLDEEAPIDTMLNSGDYEGARDEYEKYLFEAREELGEESPAYKDIAKYRWVYYLLNDDKEQAMRNIAENLSFIEQTYGKKSMEMADFLTTLSYQMLDNFEFDYAIETANEAVEICRINNQESSYVYSRANMDLVTIFVALGEAEKAKTYISNIDLNRFSGNEYLSDMIRSVGMALLEIGEYDNAVKFCKEALSIKGVDRLSKVIAAEILVIHYERAGELELAEEYLDSIKAKLDSLSTTRFAENYIITYKRLSAKIKARKANYKDAISDLNNAIEYADDKKTFVLLQCYAERALYFIYLKDLDSADKDFQICDEIISRYGLSDNYYITIYNNIACGQISSGNYESANEYFQRIIDKIPDVLSPRTFDKATICQNYGWNLFNMGKADESKIYIECAVIYYEEHGFEQSIDYYSALYNLFIVNSSIEAFEDNLNVALKLYNNYQMIEKFRNCQTNFRIGICSGIITGLLASNKEQEAYNFALSEDKYYIKQFGKKSVERIDYLQNCAYAFYRMRFTDAFEFLNKAEKIIHKLKLDNSIWEARQLNFVGIAYLDLTEYAERGNRYIVQAKELFESLNVQDDYMYPIVLQNLEKSKDRIMNKLIRDMAKNLSEEMEE